VVPDKSTDLEWRDLPVSRNDLIAEVVAVPQYTRATKLLRNATFNPRDVYLSPQSRRDIEAVIAGALPPINLLLQGFQEVCDREWHDLHAEGATTAVNLGNQGADAQLQKIGRDPMFRVEEGVTYGVTKARMPETRMAELRLKQAGVDLCRDLAAAFRARGTLTPEEETAAIAKSRKKAGLQAERR
jgi:hypothetical protein